jgi:hypothetical protein
MAAHCAEKKKGGRFAATAFKTPEKVLKANSGKTATRFSRNCFYQWPSITAPLDAQT